MDEAEKDCNKEIRKFQSSLRATDPNGLLLNTVAAYHEVCIKCPIMLTAVKYAYSGHAAAYWCVLRE